MHYNSTIKTFFIIIIALSIPFLHACKSRQKLATVEHQETKIDTLAANQLAAKQLLDSVLDRQMNADWISAKASVDADIVDDNKSFNVTLRIHNDSAIWVSINAILGVEAMRVLITKDSLKLIDRIHNKFAVADYEYLADILHIKVDYKTIESLLLGNFFGYRNETKFNSVYVEDKYYILSTLKKRKLRRSLEDKDPNKPIIQDFYIDPLTYRILSMNVEDDRINKTLHTTYTDFHPTDKGLVPLKSETKITADKNISIKIEYTKFNLGEIEEMPFRIPSGFERIVPKKK
ncbi:MAG: DUF4292 domain-containing protein [Bacteroidia bacterium]